MPGECPLLTSVFIQRWASGLQSGDDPRYLQAIASPKHFLACEPLDDYFFRRLHSSCCRDDGRVALCFGQMTSRTTSRWAEWRSLPTSLSVTS